MESLRNTSICENGGYGMLFENNENQLMYALHYPNDLYKERLQFKKVKEIDDMLVLCI